MSKIKPPLRPCVSCPYRRDVPGGVWHLTEYEKLFKYDDMEDPDSFNVFLCHQLNDRACAGWVAVHDMENSIGLRLAASKGYVTDPGAFLEFETDVELFESGTEAAMHGLRSIRDPDTKAKRMIERLEKKGLVGE